MNTNKPANSAPRDLLTRRHRWTRLSWPLAIANLGLLITLALLWHANPAFKQVLAWGRIPHWWAAGVAASLFLALVLLAMRRGPVVQSARKLDATLDAKNRLETAAHLAGAEDPMTRAQLDETADFLRSHPAPTRHWILRVLSSVLCIFILAHLLLLVAWTRPWQTATATAPVPKPTPPAAMPKASIVWKKPTAETSAAPIEEVPLTAEANSSSGLQDMTLEMSVNGEHRLSAKVPIDALDKAGKHPIAVSVYLDQLNVEPYDMVSYYLSAQRISPDKLPATTSPVQFIEVKPFREDITRMPPMGGGNAPAQKAEESIAALKLAQLRLMKENFLLTHTDLTHDNPDWLKENQRVGNDQGVLETKTDAITQQLTDMGAPAEIINLLAQARPLMKDASGKIIAEQNEPALPPQGKSLGLITSIEKYIRKVLMDSKAQAQAPPKPRDPFEKRRDLDMKPRANTPAGQLEQLAKDQEELARDMSQAAQQQQQGQEPSQSSPQNSSQQSPSQQSPSQQSPSQQSPSQQSPSQQSPSQQSPSQQSPSQQSPSQQSPSQQSPSQQSPSQQSASQQSASQQGSAQQNPSQSNPSGNPNQPSPAERQAQINQRLNDLMKGQPFAPGVNEHLEKGSAQAGESLKQLNAGDPQQAQEPAAGSARELRAAADQMNQDGQQKAMDQVADAVKLLDQAAAQASSAPGQKTDSDAKGAAQKAQDDAGQAKANLAQAAQEQQETGSGEAAARLAQFAKMLNDDKLRADMQQLHDQPRNTAQAANVSGKLNDIANQLASAQGNTPKTPEEIAQLIDRIERSKANLDRLAQMQSQSGTNGQNPGSNPAPPNPNNNPPQNPSQQQQQAMANQVLNDIRQEMADAQGLLPSKSMEGMRGAMPARAEGGSGNKGSGGFGGGNVVGTFAKIQGPLASVISLLRDRLQQAKREHDLADESDTPAPPAYRDAVADYFEQLSRDYEKSPAPGATPEPQ